MILKRKCSGCGKETMDGKVLTEKHFWIKSPMRVLQLECNKCGYSYNEGMVLDLKDMI